MKYIQWRPHRNPSGIRSDDPGLVQICDTLNDTYYYHIEERVLLRYNGYEWFTAKLPDITQIDDVINL